jgi:dihydrofolate reductase
MSMSLDGFVAGPDDGKTFPLGRHGGMHVFDWYTSGPRRPVAGGKDIKLGGASPCKEAVAAGLCDEILIHLAPYLLGGGIRLFDALPDGVHLEKLSVRDGPHATHLRYRVHPST